jgi:hypothetical protein
MQMNNTNYLNNIITGGLPYFSCFNLGYANGDYFVSELVYLGVNEYLWCIFAGINLNHRIIVLDFCINVGPTVLCDSFGEKWHSVHLFERKHRLFR